MVNKMEKQNLEKLAIKLNWNRGKRVIDFSLKWPVSTEWVYALYKLHLFLSIRLHFSKLIKPNTIHLGGFYLLKSLKLSRSITEFTQNFSFRAIRLTSTHNLCCYFENKIHQRQKDFFLVWWLKKKEGNSLGMLGDGGACVRSTTDSPCLMFVVWKNSQIGGHFHQLAIQIHLKHAHRSLAKHIYHRCLSTECWKWQYLKRIFPKMLSYAVYVSSTLYANWNECDGMRSHTHTHTDWEAPCVRIY